MAATAPIVNEVFESTEQPLAREHEWQGFAVDSEEADETFADDFTDVSFADVTIEEAMNEWPADGAEKHEQSVLNQEPRKAVTSTSSHRTQPNSSLSPAPLSPLQQRINQHQRLNLRKLGRQDSAREPKDLLGGQKLSAIKEQAQAAKAKGYSSSYSSSTDNRSTNQNTRKAELTAPPQAKPAPAKLARKKAKPQKVVRTVPNPANPSHFFHSIEQTNITIQHPRQGYWRNTYVPGSRSFRALQMQQNYPQTGSDIAVLQRLMQTNQPSWQPLDTPTGAALGLYLQTHKTAITEPSRVLLQIGLKGTERHHGRRPTMNLTFVVDASANQAQYRQHLQQLFQATLHYQRIDDRFRIVMLHDNGVTTQLKADQFRLGAIQVLLSKQPDAPNPTSSKSSAPALADALQQAMQLTQRSDDSSAPLGASAIVLISARDLTPELQPLAALAHQSALQGMPVSVVGVGSQPHWQTLDQLVLQGQGYRHWLQQPADANQVIDSALGAVSRVVARALRLNIRLGNKVQLVEIIDSQPLKKRQISDAKAAEKAIDRRLAHNLGIRADRGDDDDGLQILIPAFYSGDQHIILLDLLVQQPGPIAEVSLRYKDLIHLKNQQARSSQNLTATAQAVTPLHYNVLHNRVVAHYRQQLRQISQDLLKQDWPAAQQRLQQSLHLLSHYQQHWPLGRQQAWLQHQQQLLAQFDHLLHQRRQPRFLSRSLALNDWLNAFPRDPYLKEAR